MNFYKHEHPLVKDLATEFRSRSVDDVEFVTLAFDWVRDEIKYEILTDWTVGVEYTIEHRKGSCGTKACLLGAILKAGGIKHVRFGLQRVPTEESFFFVPSWVTRECSSRSVHMTCVVLLNDKWIHLDATVDRKLAHGFSGCCGADVDYYEISFDGRNHAVQGGHENFDPSEVVVLDNLDKYMRKKTRLLPCFRTVFNLALEYARAHGRSSRSKKILRKNVELHFVSEHRLVCKEIFNFLMQQHMSKL